MIAFVLSGGGNRGALQAGALLALLERGIKPDMIVGTSAGAANAAYLAADPSPAGAQRLIALWKEITKEDIYPGNYLTMALRFASGQDSLFPSENRRRFFESHMPPEIRRFGDVTALRLYIVATHLNTGRLHLFGEDPEESLLDAVMASTAIPPYFAPWEYEGEQYIDGAATSNLPVGVALDKGAREIYALHVVGRQQRREGVHGLLSIVGQALAALLNQQLALDLERVYRERRVKFHYIRLESFQDLIFWDFDRAAEMVEEGYRVAENYLQEQETSQAGAGRELGASLLRLVLRSWEGGKAWADDLLARRRQGWKRRALPSGADDS